MVRLHVLPVSGIVSKKRAKVPLMSCFVDVEFGAFNTRIHIYDVISLAVEMFGKFHGTIRSLNPTVSE